MTANDFLDLLRRSQLVEEDQLTNFLGLSDAEAIAAKLVRSNVLTQWQADKLLAGKWKGFHLGRYCLLDHLGKTGLAQDYLAQHDVLKRKVRIRAFPSGRVQDSTYLSRITQASEGYGLQNDGPLYYAVIPYEDDDL